jgi:ribosome-associated protein
MLRISKNIIIPDEDLQEEFSLASGAGGQKVNKTSTAVRLRFNVRDTQALPLDVKQRLLTQAANRINDQGELIIEAQNSRSQLKNREEAANRLINLIRRSLTAPKKRRPTKPTKSSVKRRLDSKKKHSSLKKLRTEKF